MNQDIVTYSQLPSRDEPHIKYYDPNVLFNQRAFTLYAGEEILLLISGSGFGIEDETIYQLEPEGTGSGKFALESSSTDRQLCMLVHNRSPTKGYHVSRRTSLASLLEMPRIKSYLCHVSIKHMAKSRLETSMRADENFASIIHNRNGDKTSTAIDPNLLHHHPSPRLFVAPFTTPASDSFSPFPANV